jgi:protein ECT2
MEPVQRIPRYTLMFKGGSYHFLHFCFYPLTDIAPGAVMLKYMDPSDPQRAKLIEADEAASKIAQAETDDQTRRAAVMIGLERSVDDFPVRILANEWNFGS